MKYTQTITKPFQPSLLGKQMPTFVAVNLGVGKTAPFFVSTTSHLLKGNHKITYKMDHDPKEDIPTSEDYRIDEGRVEINEPTIDIDDDRPNHTHYEDCKGKKKKPKLHCGGNDDEEYIEVPGGTESVEWTDPETGDTYEVDISDLQEYDGDDGEIQYTKAKKKNIPLVLMHHIKDKPSYYLNMIMAKQSMMRQFGTHQYNA